MYETVPNISMVQNNIRIKLRIYPLPITSSLAVVSVYGILYINNLIVLFLALKELVFMIYLELIRQLLQMKSKRHIVN